MGSNGAGSHRATQSKRFSWFGMGISSYLRSSAEHQIAQLAQFIMDEIPGEPSESQGAVDTAIRIMREYKKHMQELELMKPDKQLIKEGYIDKASPRV